VVQVGTSKISGRTISLQAAVHPGGGISYRNPTLKKIDVIIVLSSTPRFFK
jgi:pentose-5-phosphate-3-epimerase